MPTLNFLTDSARRLIETIAHPLNRVELTDDGRNRVRGYTIIQPRVSITLPSATATRFTRLFTDARGSDPYCQAVSDVYQDLFGEAIYHGKAIYDVRAFHKILNGRFPEQRLLSHDLIEGAHVGVGLATDVELFEQFPVRLYELQQAATPLDPRRLADRFVDFAASSGWSSSRTSYRIR